MKTHVLPYSELSEAIVSYYGFDPAISGCIGFVFEDGALVVSIQTFASAADLIGIAKRLQELTGGVATAQTGPEQGQTTGADVKGPGGPVVGSGMPGSFLGNFKKVWDGFGPTVAAEVFMTAEEQKELHKDMAALNAFRARMKDQARTPEQEKALRWDIPPGVLPGENINKK